MNWRSPAGVRLKQLGLTAFVIIGTMGPVGLLAQAPEATTGGPAGLFNELGYRVKRLRAATPQRVPYGTTVDTEALQALMMREQPVLVDVQAVTTRPETEEFGLSWLPSELRLHLPGSVWLPNVGYGALTRQMNEYFRCMLEKLTGRDHQRPVVIYCVADCWMSWNAVRRAAGYGFRRLYWYREGTDDWGAHGLPLVEATPVPLGSCAS